MIRKPEAYLYVIASVAADGVLCGPVKVGISQDPIKRVAQLRTACPYPIKGVYAFDFHGRILASEVEKHFHRHAADFRLQGEWFSFGPITALYLAATTIRACADVHGLDGSPLDSMLRYAGVYDRLPKRIAELQASGARG